MEIHVLKMDKYDRKEKGFFVRVTRTEATKLIGSLAEQLTRNDPNSGRLESYTNKGEYFTIAVVPEIKEQKCKACSKSYNAPTFCPDCLDKVIDGAVGGAEWLSTTNKRKPTAKKNKK